MNKRLLGPVAAMGLLAVASSAWATVVPDGYWGANGHNEGDIIGDAATFDVKSAEASLSGGILTVKINTNFAGKAGSDSSYTYNNADQHAGVGYGDLFLSTGWSPNGTAVDHYTNDNAANGNHWTYGFVLDNHYGSGGTGELYALHDPIANDNNPGVYLSDNTTHCSSGCIFRNGQETEVATGGNYAGVGTGVSGNWVVGADFLSFTFNLAQLNALPGAGLNPGNLGFHWNMTCGNDTIEGKLSVPEPDTIALLGMGLFGFGFVRRRKPGERRS